MCCHSFACLWVGAQSASLVTGMRLPHRAAIEIRRIALPLTAYVSPVLPGLIRPPIG